MRVILLIASLAATFCVGLFRMASADEPTGVAPTIYPLPALTCPDALLRGCCDAYCPKPLPCIRGLCLGRGPDD
jgi:hypothetical protein